MNRVLLPFLVIAGSCGSPSAPSIPTCTTDSDCNSGLVCFPDGCGDPTRNLAVEVTGGSTSGLFPQDFSVDQLGTTQDFEILGPLTLVGSFQRELTAQVDPTMRSIFTEEVLVRASGTSALIPGVSRVYQSRYAMTDRGTFSMNVGQGSYTVTAIPTNVDVPPITRRDVTSGPDGGSALGFVFPSVEGSITLAGRLVKRKGVETGADVYLTQAALDLQAFDPTTGDALSQRVETSTGRAGSRGDFIMVMSPRAKELTMIELVATPREATPKDPRALVPSRRFQLLPPFPAALTLELGDFGDPIPEVPGQVLDVDGKPLAEAAVVLDGKTQGGATFRSKTVLTDVSGNFLVDVLPAESTYTLTVYPKPGSRSGVTSLGVRVDNKPGDKPKFLPGVIRCQERVSVKGSVLLPDGAPAAVLTVRATEEVTASATMRLLPLDDVTVQTGLDGAFELRLDPGNWRIEFQPAGELPHTSRLLRVAASTSLDGGALVTQSQTLATITLPRGRRLTGMVTSSLSNRGPAPLANAQVRFFRVTRIEGKPAAVLLGAGVTNGLGAYTVILPTRDTSAKQ